MKHYSVVKILLAVCLLSGCMQPALVIGPKRAAIASEDVIVYYIDRPRCNFETIAHIRAEGGFFSLEAMVGDMREQAADIGASGLYVLQTQRSELKEYRGSAKAIRCLPA